MTVAVCPFCFNSLWENGHGEVMDYCLNCDQQLKKAFRMDVENSKVQLVQPIITGEVSEEDFKNY